MKTATKFLCEMTTAEQITARMGDLTEQRAFLPKAGANTDTVRRWIRETEAELVRLRG